MSSTSSYRVPPRRCSGSTLPGGARAPARPPESPQTRRTPPALVRARLDTTPAQSASCGHAPRLCSTAAGDSLVSPGEYVSARTLYKSARRNIGHSLQVAASSRLPILAARCRNIRAALTVSPPTEGGASCIRPPVRESRAVSLPRVLLGAGWIRSPRPLRIGR